MEQAFCWQWVYRGMLERCRNHYVSRTENISWDYFFNKGSLVRPFEKKISDNFMYQLWDTSKYFCGYSRSGLKYQCRGTTQLFVFIRGRNPHFELNEELLSVNPLKETTTGQDLFNAVENCVNITGLVWKKISSVTTDGAPALTGKNVGLVKLMKNKRIN